MTAERLICLSAKSKKKKIKEVWCEVHWAYRHQLSKFAQKFENSVVKYRTGVETFNPHLRNFWNKGIHEDVSPSDLAKYFQSVCLLVGTENQTFKDAVSDIEIAKNYFERFVVNVFIPNSKKIKKNKQLINQFMQEVYPKIKDDPKIEILANITDLGVG